MALGKVNEESCEWEGDDEMWFGGKCSEVYSHALGSCLTGGSGIEVL